MMPLLRRNLFSVALERTKAIGTIVSRKLIWVIIEVVERIDKLLVECFFAGVGTASTFIQNAMIIRVFSAVGGRIDYVNHVF